MDRDRADDLEPFQLKRLVETPAAQFPSCVTTNPTSLLVVTRGRLEISRVADVRREYSNTLDVAQGNSADADRLVRCGLRPVGKECQTFAKAPEIEGHLDSVRMHK